MIQNKCSYEKEKVSNDLAKYKKKEKFHITIFQPFWNMEFNVV